MLNDRQMRFVQEYLIDLNATQAAIRAGYSAKTAYSLGQRVLKNDEVQREIQKAQEKRSQRTRVTQDMVLQELAKIAFSNGTEFSQVVTEEREDEGGNIVPVQVVRHTDTKDLDDGSRAAVAHIKQAKNGTIEVIAHDKLKALELLGRHLGMFNNQTLDDDDNETGVVMLPPVMDAPEVSHG